MQEFEPFKSVVYPDLTVEKIQDMINTGFGNTNLSFSQQQEVKRLFNMRETIEMENLVYDFYKKYKVINRETGEEEEYYQ